MLSTMVEVNTLVPLQAVSLFSHLLNAHFIWLERIKDCPLTYSVWQEHSLSDLLSLSEQAYQRTQQLLLSDEYGVRVNAKVHYQNTKGKSFQNTVQEILTHVSHHTTHHRAQIVYLLRQHNIAPPATDYIYYQRITDP